MTNEIKFTGFSASDVKVHDAGGSVGPEQDLEALLASRARPVMQKGPVGLIPVDRPSYLIRVDFGPDATVRGETTGTVSLFQFSKIPNLSLLAQIYTCEDRKCAGVMDSSCQMGDKWICPKCHKVWDFEQDIGSGILLFRQTMDQWGDTLARYYERLHGMAEVLLMRRRVSITKLTHDLMDKVTGAERRYQESYSVDPKNRIEASYYTLAKIHTELAKGAMPGKVFSTFVKGG